MLFAVFPPLPFFLPFKKETPFFINNIYNNNNVSLIEKYEASLIKRA
jgi:hypothetical protein